jgi:tetratricopeptide (TPR) repeat protein
MVKLCWFCVVACCFLVSVVSVRGQAAGALLQQGQDAMSHGDYATAAKAFDTIVTTYPSTANIEDITISDGFAQLHAGNYDKTISVLATLTSPGTKPAFRGKALFFTGMAQFSKAHALGDKNQGPEAVEAYRQAEATMGTLLTFITQNPTPDNVDLTEDAMYYQALSAYGEGPNHFGQAESDLNNLLGKFPASLQKPDYLLLLGSIYAVQASNAAIAKQPDVAHAAAAKAITIFDQVASDPNALVQANEANMRKAETLYLIAQLDPTESKGFEDALDVFRKVHRKEDMIVLQQKRIDQLRAAQASALQGGASLGGGTGRLLDRETARLSDLQAGPDPIVQALIRMAECYVSMKNPDAARTILHRLRGVTLTPTQQQEVDFQYLFSYTLGGLADKANAALDDYLAKHPGDPQADSISVQIAIALGNRSDYAGELAAAQRSLKDFPNGKHVSDAVELESDALTKLGRIDEAGRVIDDFLKKNPNNPIAYGLLVTRGIGQLQKGDRPGALATFAQVKNAPAAGEYRSTADAYYINTLNDLERYKEVVAEAKQFETKYPNDKALGSVSVIGAMAMDKTGDPGAIPALQAVAKKFSDELPIASYALYYVVEIYQQESTHPAKYPNAVTSLTQAVKDLRTSFPTAFALISQANDVVTELLEKQKKFDEAAALFEPLLTAPDQAVAAGAQNRIGDIWFAGAKAMGSYQSLQEQPPRDEAQKRLKASEDAYVATLTHFPGQLGPVGDAFDGLVSTGQLRIHWGLVPPAGLEDYIGQECAGLTSPEMQTRVELARAGTVFVQKDARGQYPATLARFDKAIAATPTLQLTRTEADHYGALLIAAKKYPEALTVYNALLTSASSSDQVQLATAYYGLGATYLASGDLANAKIWFVKMQGLPGGAAWSTHSMDANIGMAEIDEQSSSPADQAAAKQAYADIMVAPLAGPENQAKALLGYGRILEKEGATVKAAPGQSPTECAVHYYEQVNLFYGSATPELSAEGLYLAAQAYAKAGDTARAAAEYATLRSSYAKTAPDWVAKIPAQ